MTEQNIPEMLKRAKELDSAGKNAEAAGIYQEILAAKPDHAEVLHLYSVNAINQEAWGLAINLIQRAVAAAPNWAFLHANLGLAYRRSGQLQSAINSYMRAIELDPSDINMILSFGSLLGECELFNEAIQVYKKIIELNRNVPEAYSGLGVIYLSQSLYQNALDAFSLALKLKPDYLDAVNGLGITQMCLGLDKEAQNTFLWALGICPESITALLNLGLLEEEFHNYEKAYDFYSRAATCKPDDIDTLNNLSRVSLLMYNTEKAKDTIQAALKLDSLNLKTLSNLALEQRLSGNLDSSINTLRKVLSLAPQETEAHSDLIFTMHYSPCTSPKAILDECAIWSDKFEQPKLLHNAPLMRDCVPDKKLKIGFVSPDFYQHSVGRLLVQLFASRDNSQYDIYCYSNSDFSDPITLKLQSHSNVWRSIKHLSDFPAANLIRADQIDILIDLSLHSGSNRLLIFPHRPAPIQMSYLGYPSTTGMKSIDYRISDRFIDPENEISHLYSEETLYITSYWCYSEPAIKIPVSVSTLPALKNNFITFGCLNNTSKISEPTIQCWIKLLKEIPNSRLLLYCPVSCHGKALIEKFGNGGVDKSRIVLIARQLFTKYLESYNQIDIALDPFPFGGGITTCDTLWMGVPVVSLRGKTAVGRGSASILSNIGMSDLIANSEEEYISIAKNLCRDLDALAAIRNDLREKLQQSPVMDGRKFAFELGQIFCQTWAKYCRNQNRSEPCAQTAWSHQ
jgi:predicted O-linked N-acetylglucosamine transferase (SPINDLY family)